MADIAALKLLAKELGKVKSIPKPPTDYSQVGTFKKNTAKVISKCAATITDVKQYATRIDVGIDEVRNALGEVMKQIQNAITNALDKADTDDGPNVTSRLKYVQELLEGANSMMKLQESMIMKVEEKKAGLYDKEVTSICRLKEMLNDTSDVFANVQANVGVTMDEIDRLKGYLESWMLGKNESYKEEKDRIEHAQMWEAELERQDREEEEREQKIQEENKRKEENRKEKEQERKREEEKRKEQERIREEEERKEQERIREEEKRKEQDRIREEEKRRKEEEKRLKIKEEERVKRDKIERAERLRRQDPNNWKTNHYDRSTDQVDGDRSYHKNRCCVISTLPPENGSDEFQPDLECLASDEVDDVIETLNDGEKLASSVVSIKSKKGKLSLETPMRVFVPHCTVSDPGDEMVIKVSLNGSDWVISTPLLPSKQIAEKYGTQLLGTEVDKFENVKLVIVARRKTQAIGVDKPGINQFIYSDNDTNIKMFVPKDTVSCPVELQISVKPITDEALRDLREDSPTFEGVSSAGPLITLSCQRPLAKGIRIELGRKSSNTNSYYMYRLPDRSWRFAEADSNGKTVSVILPKMKSTYRLIPIDLSVGVQKEIAPEIAESIYDYTNKTVVRVLFRQNQKNQANAIVHCVKRECVPSRRVELNEKDYTIGNDSAKNVYLSDGQKISISCIGNIDFKDGDGGKVEMPFFEFMDTAKKELEFRVKDASKQRELPKYLGHLICTIHDPKQKQAGQSTVLRIDLPISLPKLDLKPVPRTSTTARVPYYLSALAYFLACKLTEKSKDMWLNVLEKLETKDAMQARHRRAKGKAADKTDATALCHHVILDWMKTTERRTDKVIPIEKALEEYGLYALKIECHKFVAHLKEHLSDTAMTNIAKKLTGDPKQIGAAIGLEERLVTEMLRDNPGERQDQIEALLREWRHSEAAINSGISADKRLKSLLNL